MVTESYQGAQPESLQRIGAGGFASDRLFGKNHLIRVLPIAGAGQIEIEVA
jgi:hypothetical protein